MGVCEVLLAFEEAPAALGQDGILALFFEPAGLLGTDFVEGLAEVLHDVKAVKNVDRRGQPLADDGQVGFPDITTDDGNAAQETCRFLRASRFLLALVLLLQFGEAVVQALFGPLFAYPQQPPTVGVDLVEQGQIVMALTKLDFIHAQGGDVVEAAMSDAIFDHVLDGMVDLVPTAPEGAGHLRPRQLLRPPRQEAPVDVGQVVLARAPRHLLNDHPATGFAGHPAHPIRQIDRKTPERNELEQPWFGSRVIGG